MLDNRQDRNLCDLWIILIRFANSFVCSRTNLGSLISFSNAFSLVTSSSSSRPWLQERLRRIFPVEESSRCTLLYACILRISDVSDTMEEPITTAGVERMSSMTDSSYPAESSSRTSTGDDTTASCLHAWICLTMRSVKCAMKTRLDHSFLHFLIVGLELG